MKYKRILLKLSGESLMGASNYGIDSDSLADYINEIKSVFDNKVQIAIVIGGGNIFRGLQGTNIGLDRVDGDHMGMLATIINSVAIKSALKNKNIESVILSGIPVENIAEKMTREKAIKLLEDNKIVIISGGTGNPYFTTDTAAALRAVEIKADIILKGTRVDGVYTEDPEKNPKAVKYDLLSFNEAYQKNLKIMDLTAFTLCKENNIPIIVFDINKKGNLLKIVSGEKIGTLVTN